MTVKNVVKWIGAAGTAAIIVVAGLGCGGKDGSKNDGGNLEASTVTDSVVVEKIVCADLGKTGTFTDTRDGQTYRTVVMPDGKTWMAENLNFVVEDTGSYTGSWCWDDSAGYCDMYGRLYEWDAARLACPEGWRLPDTADWNDLINAAGGDEIAGKRLKATGGWQDCRGDCYNTADGKYEDCPKHCFIAGSGWGECAGECCNAGRGGGTDIYGFSALPGGHRKPYGGPNLETAFFLAGYYGYWWSATVETVKEEDSILIGRAYIMVMDYESGYARVEGVFHKILGYSVRCVLE